jgi:hypothetical protein
MRRDAWRRLFFLLATVIFTLSVAGAAESQVASTFDEAYAGYYPSFFPLAMSVEFVD